MPQLVCGEDWSAADAQAPQPQPVCYAQQRAPLPDEEDSVSVDSEPQESQHSEAADYGIVLPAAVQAQSSPYRTQEHTVNACEDEPDDQAQIFLDWSPETRQLKIPLMGSSGLEDEAEIRTEAVTLLPNLILRQSSGEHGEPEPEPEPETDDFIKMERAWGLVIHSSPD